MAEDNFREVYGYATTPDEAKASAKTQAKRIERSKKSVELTMPGTNAIIAGMHINLAGFRQGISGRYKVVTVRHTVSRSGWTTSITGEGA
jgi:phage protein D